MSGKEDLRVRRTKKALFDAFMKLLSEKPFDEITVNELCDVAGIRRATFYKHYSDKYDFLTAYTCLLRDRFDRIIWKSEKPVLNSDYYVEYAKRLIYFVNENSTAVDNLYKSYLFPSIIAIVLQQNYKNTCERLRISVASGMELPASVETVAVSCTGAVAACISRWLEEGKKTDPDQVAEEVGIVISNILGQK